MERTLATIGLAIAPLLLLALYGFFRLRRMRDVLDPDWHVLAEFGAALRAFTLSAVHDGRSFAALVALAPDVEPLLRPGTAPASLPAQLAALPCVRDEAGAHPAPGAGEARLTELTARVIDAERLLQAEMQRLVRQEASLPAWVQAGVAGLVLAGLGSLGDRRTSARTRRRLLEANPRFQDAVLVLTLVGAAAAFGVAGVALFGALRRLAAAGS